MYKKAIINSLVNLADIDINDAIPEESTTNSVGEVILPKYDIKNVPKSEYREITLSPRRNEAAYSLRNAMQRGSGVDLSDLKTYRVNDLYSATDVNNMVRFNPVNTPIAMHEYGHVIDKPSLAGVNLWGLVHPAIGDIYRYRQELDANRKGLAAFRKGVAHNKALGDEMAKAHSMVKDKALATYRSVLYPRVAGSIGGSALGGLIGLGYSSARNDPTLTKILNTAGGAWLGGQVGGLAGTVYAIPGNIRATKDFVNTLKSQEYKDAVNSVNRNLVADARKNDYYRGDPVVTDPSLNITAPVT